MSCANCGKPMKPKFCCHKCAMEYRVDRVCIEPDCHTVFSARYANPLQLRCQYHQKLRSSRLYMTSRAKYEQSGKRQLLRDSSMSGREPEQQERML